MAAHDEYRHFEPSVTRGFLARPIPPWRRTAPWLMALLLLCLLPRAVMATRLPVICPDGVLYLNLAAALERGDARVGFGTLRLNTYPPILMVLHQFGLDWELAGKLWGVLASSLAVLPLFGWIRRQFSERVAWIAGVLYALHPKMIEWSPELVRDQTFWLLAALTLYTSWRAVTEVRLYWYAAAGLAIALAVHTRFEGWFLYLPLLIWSGWRCREVAERRRWVVPGAALALAVCPLLLLTVNLTLLRNHDRWELGNFKRLEYVSLWVHASWDRAFGTDAAVELEKQINQPVMEQLESPSPTVVALQPAAAQPPASPTRMPLGKLIRSYFDNLQRGYSPVFGLLMLIGLARWPHIWRGREHQPLFYVALLVMAGIWVHMWYGQASSSRYVMLLVMFAAPFAALGWMATTQWLTMAVLRRTGQMAHARVALAMLLLPLAVLCVGDAVTSRDLGREREAAMGRWIERELGHRPRIVIGGRSVVVAHYARSETPYVAAGDSAQSARAALDSTPADAVIVWRHASKEVLDTMRASARQYGLMEVAGDCLPPPCTPHDVLVLVREVPKTSLPTEPAPATARHLWFDQPRGWIY